MTTIVIEGVLAATLVATLAALVFLCHPEILL
jgi:hypothetical protein